MKCTKSAYRTAIEIDRMWLLEYWFPYDLSFVRYNVLEYCSRDRDCLSIDFRTIYRSYDTTSLSIVLVIAIAWVLFSWSRMHLFFRVDWISLKFKSRLLEYCSRDCNCTSTSASTGSIWNLKSKPHLYFRVDGISLKFESRTIDRKLVKYRTWSRMKLIEYWTVRSIDAWLLKYRSFVRYDVLEY